MREVYTIYVLTSDVDIDEPLKDIRLNIWQNYADGVMVKYISKKAQNATILYANIQEVRPDFLYLNSMFSYFFTILPLRLFLFKQINVKIVLATRGMLHEGAMKYKFLKKKIFLFFLRNLGLCKKIYFQATDEKERLDIIKHLGVPDCNIQVVPNLPKTQLSKISSIQKDIKSLRLVFISRVAPKKNLLFFLKCLSVLKSDCNIILTIYGSTEEGYWDKCVDVLSILPHNIHVFNKGSINHDKVENVLQQHHFFILPTFGENFGHAIFEAFAAGRPVIISNKTPWRNLEEKKIGWDISLSEHEKYIQVIKRAALMNQEEYDVWSQSSWLFAKRFIETSGLREKYIKLFS